MFIFIIICVHHKFASQVINDTEIVYKDLRYQTHEIVIIVI